MMTDSTTFVKQGRGNKRNAARLQRKKDMQRMATARAAGWKPFWRNDMRQAAKQREVPPIGYDLAGMWYCICCFRFMHPSVQECYCQPAGPTRMTQTRFFADSEPDWVCISCDNICTSIRCPTCKLYKPGPDAYVCRDRVNDRYRCNYLVHNQWLEVGCINCFRQRNGTINTELLRLPDQNARRDFAAHVFYSKIKRCSPFKSVSTSVYKNSEQHTVHAWHPTPEQYKKATERKHKAMKDCLEVPRTRTEFAECESVADFRVTVLNDRDCPRDIAVDGYFDHIVKEDIKVHNAMVCQQSMTRLAVAVTSQPNEYKICTDVAIPATRERHLCRPLIDVEDNTYSIFWTYDASLTQ